MRHAAIMLLVTCLAGFSAAYAGDWPEWRGPRRDGVAADSPPLVDEFPKEGPKKVWESEPIPGGHNGGFAQPAVAEGKVFVFYNCRFEKPIETRILRRGDLTELGWMPGIPDDLAKAMEDARASEARAALKDNNAVNAWADAWIKDNLKPDQRKFQYVVKKRLTLGAQALPLDTLAKIEPIADKEFASQGEFDRWLLERGLDEPARKKIMDRIPTKVNACNDVLFCLDRAKGQTEWKQELTGNWMWYAASSTPAVSEGRCYFLGSGAVASSLNTADGSVVWQSKPLGAAQHSHNRSSSILLEGGKAFVATDTAFTALDAKTGEVAWTARGVLGKESSAIVWRSGGAARLLLNASGKLTCVDPADGKVVWAAATDSTAATPVVVGDIAVFSSGGKKAGLVAWRLSADGATPLWTVPFVDWAASVVALGKHVYAIGGGNATAEFGEKGKGRALCVEIETGKVAWEQPIPEGAELSSPVLADGKIIAQAGAWLCLIKATPDKFDLLGKANLGLAPWTSPAFSDGFLFLRTNQGVTCYDLRK